MKPLSVRGTAGPRWRRYFRPASTVFSERALLPGWGDAKRARRIFLTAALKPPLEDGTLATCGAALTAFAFGMGLAAYLAILGIALVIGSTSAASSLFALAEQEPERDRLRVALLAAFVVVVPVTAFWAARQGPFGLAAAPILDCVCLAWSAAMLWVCVAAYRRIAARPHPFLMP